MNQAKLTVALSFSLLSCIGCGTDCIAPDGDYEIVTTLVSGDCGDGTTTTLSLGPSTDAPPGCTRVQRINSDGCGGSYDLDCVDLIQMERTTILGEWNVSSDGTSIAGTYSIDVGDEGTGSPVCSGVYDFAGDLQP